MKVLISLVWLQFEHSVAFVESRQAVDMGEGGGGEGGLKSGQRLRVRVRDAGGKGAVGGGGGGGAQLGRLYHSVALGWIVAKTILGIRVALHEAIFVV